MFIWVWNCRQAVRAGECETLSSVVKHFVQLLRRVSHGTFSEQARRCLVDLFHVFQKVELPLRRVYFCIAMIRTSVGRWSAQ